MAKATETVAVKVRMREQLRRDIERIAIRNDRSTNSEIVRLLEAAVIADKAGIIGVDGMIRVVKATSASDAVQEMLRIWQAKMLSAETLAKQGGLVSVEMLANQMAQSADPQSAPVTTTDTEPAGLRSNERNEPTP
jgi:Arc/MetJ-type ribon-helix-helix transcriptional regulator